MCLLWARPEFGSGGKNKSGSKRGVRNTNILTIFAFIFLYTGTGSLSRLTLPHLTSPDATWGSHLSLASELTFFVLTAGHLYEWKYKGNLHKTYKPQSIIRYLKLYITKTRLYEVSGIRTTNYISRIFITFLASHSRLNCLQ